MKHKHKLLLVYPDQEKADTLRLYLNASGFLDVTYCDDGRQAVELARSANYDAVIADVDLGSIDVWQLTRLIRSGILTLDDDTPVYVVSSSFREQIAKLTAKKIEATAFFHYCEHEQLADILLQELDQHKHANSKSRLLIIEDYTDTVNLVVKVLGARYIIDTATNGEQGLALWREHKHDLILLDLMLPITPGEDVLQQVMTIDPAQAVVIMSAHADAERASELILQGAADFITKPFRAEQLRHVCDIASHRQDYRISNQEYIDRHLDLSNEQERAQVTLASINEGVITTDAEGNIEYLNPTAETLIGWKTEDVQNQSLSEIFQTFHEHSKSPAINPLEKCLREQREIKSNGNILLRNRYAKELMIEHSAAPIRNSNAVITGAVMVFRDTTETTMMAQQLSYHASHDPLTGLNNREVLEKTLQLALNDSKTSADLHTLCHININRFKAVNDSCGHAAGDRLLQELSQIICNSTRSPSDIVSRIGGDEFGLLLRHCPVISAERVASNILEQFEHFNFEHEGNTFKISASIGMVQVTQDTNDLQEILSCAETASQIASESGGSRYHIFRSDDDEQLQRRSEVKLISLLTNAEQENRFELYCQTIAACDCDDLPSYEILLRMRNHEGEMIAPGYFLSVAERYNMMTDIDRWVIKNSLRFLANNNSLFTHIHHISINLSGLSLIEDGFYDFIAKEFISSGIPPEKICFEITETAAISNFVRASSFIAAIRELGCKFALDDFGSGMSSFAYLKKLPVDFLKIDGMFVKGMVEDSIDHAMVKSINDIGHELQLKTIAEFVENQAVFDALKILGVDYAQGYGIAKPMPVIDLISKYNANSVIA